MNWIEVITSVERRRRWSRAEKERWVSALMEPGAVAAEVARKAGVDTSSALSLASATCLVARDRHFCSVGDQCRLENVSYRLRTGLFKIFRDPLWKRVWSSRRPGAETDLATRKFQSPVGQICTFRAHLPEMPALFKTTKIHVKSYSCVVGEAGLEPTKA